MSHDHEATEQSDDQVLTDDQGSTNGRRALLRRAAVIGGATIAGGAIMTNQAAAVDPNDIAIGAANTGTTQTTLDYTGTPLTAATARSVLSAGDMTNGGNNLFPAGVGGYGGTTVGNGVHGSTVVATGFGVVAANRAAPAAGIAAPKALALASLGSQVQFLTPAAVRTAAGLPAAAQIGPSAGTHVAGEMYVDDAFNLWFSVPVAGSTTEVRWIRLAGQQTAGSLVTLPVGERILDTRANNGGKVPSGTTVTVNLKTKFGGAASSLPVGAMAALINITVDATENQGFHTAYSADATFDANSPFSSINWDATGQIRANTSVVTLGRASAATERAIKITAGGGGNTHVIVDLVGYYL